MKVARILVVAEDGVVGRGAHLGSGALHRVGGPSTQDDGDVGKFGVGSRPPFDVLRSMKRDVNSSSSAAAAASTAADDLLDRCGVAGITQPRGLLRAKSCEYSCIKLDEQEERESTRLPTEPLTNKPRRATDRTE